MMESADCVSVHFKEAKTNECEGNPERCVFFVPGGPVPKIPESSSSTEPPVITQTPPRIKEYGKYCRYTVCSVFRLLFLKICSDVSHLKYQFNTKNRNRLTVKNPDSAAGKIATRFLESVRVRKTKARQTVVLNPDVLNPTKQKTHGVVYFCPSSTFIKPSDYGLIRKHTLLTQAPSFQLYY